MRIQKFLSRKRLNAPEDIELQLEMWAYIIAKHYSISLKEVHEMNPKQFKQSLTWAMVGQEEENKEREKQSKKSKSSSSGSSETVSIDYDWALEEEF